MNKEYRFPPKNFVYDLPNLFVSVEKAYADHKEKTADHESKTQIIRK